MGRALDRFSTLLRCPPLGRPAAWLTLAGLTLALYVAGFSIPFFLGKYYAVPQLAWRDIAGSGVEVAAAYTLLILALFGLYYLGYRALIACPGLSPWAIYVPPVVFGLALLITYPPGGWDLFLYISQGRLFSQHHLNPFLVTPQDAPTDLFLSYSSWWPYPSTYGPAWQTMASLISMLGGDSLWLSAVLFKTVAALFFLGSVILVYLIMSRYRKEMRHPAAYLLAWNPLILFEIVGNGHNDIVMAFFVLLSIYALVQERRLWALPALALSALVKYSSAIFLPGLVLSLLAADRRPRQKALWIIGGLTLSAVTVMLFARPFGVVYSLPALAGLEEWYLSSPAGVLFLALQGNFPRSQATYIVKGAIALTLGPLYVYEVVRFLRRNRMAELGSLLRFGYQSTFLFLLVLPRFHPWFVTWLLAFGVLMIGTEPARRALLLSFTSFLTHIVYQLVWGIFPDVLNVFTIETINATLTFGPPLLYWLHFRSTSRRVLAEEKDRTIALQEAEIQRLKALLSSSARPGRAR